MNRGYDAVDKNRADFARDDIRLVEHGLYPFLKVVENPQDYPSYRGGTEGFHSTALPKVCNPIIAADDEKRTIALLHTKFPDGTAIDAYLPSSDGYVYREFVMENEQIVALANKIPGGSPTLNDVMLHCTLGYLGIRKVKLEEDGLQKELVRFGLDALENRGVNHYGCWNFYRQLDVEEQGLSTNLRRKSAEFMPGCKMHRMSLAEFLDRFPFGDNSMLLADWDYGLATDAGHVDIKLNPLYLAKAKPWSGKMLKIDGNFYRDMLNELLRDHKDLWTAVR